MSNDVVRRYNGARPIQAPAQLLADAIHEVEVLREENARLIRENKVAFEAVGGVVKANDKLKEENARLKEEIERQRKRVNIWVNRAHELGHGESFD